MSLQWDFAVYGPNGAVIALIEAKRRLGTTRAWATEWRRAAAQQSAARASMLLIAPDRLYAWAPGAPQEAAPDRELDSRTFLGPYFRRAGMDPTAVDPTTFEDVVDWWLRDLLGGRVEPLPLELRLEGATLVREARA